jgi:hypothetical protein
MLTREDVIAVASRLFAVYLVVISRTYLKIPARSRSQSRRRAGTAQGAGLA